MIQHFQASRFDNILLFFPTTGQTESLKATSIQCLEKITLLGESQQQNLNMLCRTIGSQVSAFGIEHMVARHCCEEKAQDNITAKYIKTSCSYLS